MRYSGIQPQYFPRLHYFARVLQADVFMIRDDVQFVAKHKYPDGKIHKSYQAHTPVKKPSGHFLLPVSIKHEGVLRSIQNIPISYESKWDKKHLKYLKVGYKEAPFFSNIYINIKQLISIKYKNLSELNTQTILWSINLLLGNKEVEPGKNTLSSINNILSQESRVRLKQIRRASQSVVLSKYKKSDPNKNIIRLMKETNTDENISGETAAKAYMDLKLMKKHRIKVAIQDWKCPHYPQQFTNKYGFFPNLSIIDLLMNVAPAEALRILIS